MKNQWKRAPSKLSTQPSCPGIGDPPSAGALGAITLRPQAGEGVWPLPPSPPVSSSPPRGSGLAGNCTSCAPNHQGVL